MPRYWVIAPYHADQPEAWEKVWQFDLEHGLISIGWKELGDVSSYSKGDLKQAVDKIYANAPANIRTLYFNMIWAFYHTIQPGDMVIARKGRKKIAAVGTVTSTAYFKDAKAIDSSAPDDFYFNHINVRWHDSPRDKKFSRIVFGMQTLYEIDQTQFQSLVEEETTGFAERLEEGVEDQAEFVLEKYLEDFIVTNFSVIFGNQLVLYRDPQENVIGQQYATEVGNIDILAVEPDTKAFVVIELKKGRGADKVVGQVLRYMGWVSDNLATEGQPVKGMIICKEADPKLFYALRVVDNIEVRYYRVNFKLVTEG